MAKYHINDKGEAGICTATQGGCPFGGDAQHYSSAELARSAYELSMAGPEEKHRRFAQAFEFAPLPALPRDEALPIEQWAAHHPFPCLYGDDMNPKDSAQWEAEVNHWGDEATQSTSISRDAVRTWSYSDLSPSVLVH